MTTGISILLERLRSSLWFIPTVMSTAAGAIAIGTVHFEQRLATPLSESLPFFYSGSPSGARELLSTIAGSMITIAGVSFSIVIVALSLASNQFGHRLLRNFMRDRANQVVLGTFISTFVYCLLVLRAIRSVDDRIFVPGLSVTLGIGFGVLSLAVLIYFIHHVSESIQADHVIRVISGELERSIDRLFPEQIGQELANEPARPAATEDATGWMLRPKRDGYLQAIDNEKLMHLVEKRDLFVNLLVRPGSFLTTAIPVASVRPESSESEDLEESLNDCFSIGQARTTQQDIDFAIDQLVEVAVRALSPGINAPFTATACLDRLLQSFSRIVNLKLPSGKRVSETGVLRLTAPATDFRSLCDRAFRPIRHYGSSSPLVLSKLMDVLSNLVSVCQRPDRRAVLLEHASETKRAGELNLQLPSALQDLASKYDQIVKESGKTVDRD